MRRGEVCILAGGPTQRIVDARGKEWRFEDHPQCGPNVVNANDAPLANQPGSRSPFWHAVQLWYEQGKQVGDDELCVWAEPPPLKVEHIVGRHYRLVPV